jgi:hypothetical protein
VTDRARELIEQALYLSPEEREQIGTALLDSIDDEAHREIISRRIAQIERGDDVVRDAFDVYHRLRAKRRA